jgi:K+-sensing histidine kinase KdpD
MFLLRHWWIWWLFAAMDKEMRTWDTYITLEATVKNMLTSLRAVAELQNSAIRERHWQQLMKSTKVMIQHNLLMLCLYYILVNSFHSILCALFSVIVGLYSSNCFILSYLHSWNFISVLSFVHVPIFVAQSLVLSVKQ